MNISSYIYLISTYALYISYIFSSYEFANSSMSNKYPYSSTNQSGTLNIVERVIKCSLASSCYKNLNLLIFGSYYKTPL